MADIYDVTDLGTLKGYQSSRALCVGSKGHVVGYCERQAAQSRRAFMWIRGEKMHDLGTLGGAESVAYSVNEHGVVVGASETGQGEHHAFIWSKSTGITDLGFPERFSAAFGINNNGSIVGRHGEDYLPAVGFLRNSAGVSQDIAGVVGLDFSGALALNDKDEVTGWYGHPEFAKHFLWSGGKLIDIGVCDICTPRAVNWKGIVVGDGGFRWNSTAGTTSLVPLPGDEVCWAKGINYDGMIVGGSTRLDGTPQRAVVWIGTVPQDLNTLTSKPTIQLEFANWIADSGVICGWGLANGTTHAWVAEPQKILMSVSDYPKYNPWWDMVTGGGRLPDPDPPPWLASFEGALALARSVNRVSPGLRAVVRELVLEHTSAISASIKEELEVLGRRGSRAEQDGRPRGGGAR